MTAQGFVWLLLAEYLLAAVWFAIEGNRPKALYFLGSVVITLAVIWME